jgi:hypothetical protein
MDIKIKYSYLFGPMITDMNQLPDEDESFMDRIKILEEIERLEKIVGCTELDTEALLSEIHQANADDEE